MIGVFRKKSSGNVFMLFIIGVLLKLPAFFHSVPAITKKHDSLLFLNFISFLKPVATTFPYIYSILAFALLFLQAYLLTRFINTNRLMLKMNFLPGMAYMIITSFIPELNVVSSSLLASTLFILVFTLLFSSQYQKVTKGRIFNAGMILGIAALLFLPSVFFIIWAFIALATLRPFKLNEWLLLLMGVLAPYYFLSAFLFLKGSFTVSYFYNGLLAGFVAAKYNIWHAIAVFLILMPLLSGLYYIQTTSGRMLIHVRKAWHLFIIYTFICIIISFFNVDTALENWALVMLPIAAIHGYGYFNAEWKLYPKIFFWLSVLFIASSQLFSQMW